MMPWSGPMWICICKKFVINQLQIVHIRINNDRTFILIFRQSHGLADRNQKSPSIVYLRQFIRLKY